MDANNKIIIEFTLNEAKVLCGAIASFVPNDESHELILIMLYSKIKRKLEDFTNR